MPKPTFKTFLKKSKFNYSLAKDYFNAYDEILDLGLFDKNFYLGNYRNVLYSGMDPLLHYLFHGYKEGKFPNMYFEEEIKSDNIDYGDINPLVYYLKHKDVNSEAVKNKVEIAKNRILSTNLAFINNYDFDSEPLVSIIILNRDGLHHLKRLFTDFDLKTNYSNYEIIIVDNASSDGSVEYLESLDLPIRIIKNDVNVSFSKGNNDAAKIANGEYLLLLNNDMEPTYSWLNEMMGIMLNNENVGSVGAKLVFPYYSDIDMQNISFSIQHASVKFREVRTSYIYGPYHEHMHNTLIFSDSVNHTKEVIACTAAALLVPKDLYFKLDGLDENYFYGYEDIDLAFKIYEERYKNIYCASALLFHHESATRSQNKESAEINAKNIEYFMTKWDKTLFKLMLKDKLEENHFLTDKKLHFSIVTSENVSDDFILKLSRDLNDKDYDIDLVLSTDELYLSEVSDVLISFNVDYDLKRAISKLNLIKILVLNEYDSSKKDFINYYDIILVTNNDLKNKISKDNVFLLDLDYNDLDKDYSLAILKIIRKTYL